MRALPRSRWRRVEHISERRIALSRIDVSMLAGDNETSSMPSPCLLKVWRLYRGEEAGDAVGISISDDMKYRSGAKLPALKHAGSLGFSDART